MNKFVPVVALVEGAAEKTFLRDLVAPYLSGFGIYLSPTLLSKPGQKGGDVKFERAQNDIRNHLRQRPDTYVTLFIDFYATKGTWPGLAEARRQTNYRDKAALFNKATYDRVVELFGSERADVRFKPYVSMHEFEALLFSDPASLSTGLNVPIAPVAEILASFGGVPEAINDDANTAPSKRLLALSDRFKKTTTGIAIAKSIGLPTIRRQCPLFDEWLTMLESLTSL